MKINRLFEIVSILLSKGSVTARELAERFGVSTRTIYRDIDVLSSSGIPVYTNKGYQGGITLMDHYTINKTIISKKNAESILIALKTLQAANYPEIQSTLDRFASLFHSIRAEDWVEVDFTPWDVGPDTDKRFEDIKRSIIDRLHVQIEYINRFNETRTRMLSPLKLIFKARSWYLKAYCHEKKSIRLFKLTRIKQLAVLDSTFDRDHFIHMNTQPPSETKEPQPMVNLKLKFQPNMLYRLYDDYDTDRLVPQEDGSYLIYETFPLDEWVYSYILSFGPFVEVLEPHEVRQVIKERLRKGLNVYKIE